MTDAAFNVEEVVDRARTELREPLVFIITDRRNRRNLEVSSLDGLHEFDLKRLEALSAEEAAEAIVRAVRLLRLGPSK